MLVEARTQHLAKFRPRKERRRARMRRDEAFAIVSHEFQQILTLLLIEIDLTHAEEKDRVEVIQVARQEVAAVGRNASSRLEKDRRLRNRLRIRPNDRVVYT